MIVECRPRPAARSSVPKSRWCRARSSSPAVRLRLRGAATTTASTTQAGFLFNGASNSANLPNTNLSAGPGIVGFQGATNLGVGRVSPTAGVGGLVISAGSDSFNVLIRALKTQRRLEILSRPQIMTTDKQAANILIGQQVPYVTGTNTIATGIVTNTINYRPTGVQLQVTPQINPDGRIIMRVTPEISSVANSTVAVGNGVNATLFNTQTVDTTVSAMDGETVAIGGLITKSNTKTENSVPWLGDLPWIGAAFRYRTQAKEKREILVIMTPIIVRNRADAERVMTDEATEDGLDAPGGRRESARARSLPVKWSRAAWASRPLLTPASSESLRGPCRPRHRYSFRSPVCWVRERSCRRSIRSSRTPVMPTCCLRGSDSVAAATCSGSDDAAFQRAGSAPDDWDEPAGWVCSASNRSSGERSAELCSADDCSPGICPAELCSADYSSAELCSAAGCFSAELRTAELCSADDSSSGICSSEFGAAGLFAARE